MTTAGRVAACLALGAALAAPASSPAAAARPRPACDRMASVRGSDGAAGTVARPFRTIRRLLGSLRPGSVGCLAGGTFVENVSFAAGGAPGRRIVLRSAPGMRARIEGYVLIRDSANYVTLAHLDVDGHDVTPITVHVNGDAARLDDLDVTNRDKQNDTYTGSCILLGRVGLPAVEPTIARSRIHDCGSSGHDHGIYAEFPRRAVIRDNYIYGSAGYGISMYPDAQSTLIVGNVIDGNGHGNITFSGERAGGEYDRDYASSNNVVTRNIITNAGSRYNVESFYPSLQPVGNSVAFNCVWNAPYGNFGYRAGYAAHDNVDADPRYVDRDAGDYRLRRGSPCAGYGPGRRQPRPSPPHPSS